jgi:hypothetical protein
MILSQGKLDRLHTNSRLCLIQERREASVEISRVWKEDLVRLDQHHSWFLSARIFSQYALIQA